MASASGMPAFTKTFRMNFSMTSNGINFFSTGSEFLLIIAGKDPKNPTNKD
jgi:hypothetical protein